MLVRHIVAPVVGPVDVGIFVGIADGYVQNRYIKTVFEYAGQLFAFFQPGNQAAVRLYAETVGIGKTVVHVQAAGQEEISSDVRPGRAVCVEQKTGAVLKTAAVGAGTGVGGQQFAGQVTVAAFHIHTVKASGLGQAGGLSEAFLVGFELVVRQNAALRQGSILEQRVVVGDQRFRIAVGFGVAS